MSAIFHGWRRKTGVVTLALACIFTAGWVRSLTFTDQLCFRVVNEETLQSVNGSLRWWSDTRPPNRISIPEFFHTSLLDDWSMNDGSDLNWKLGLIVFDQEDVVTLRVIRYQSLAVPLIVLSVWLLLIKSRRSTPQVMVESKPDTLA